MVGHQREANVNLLSSPGLAQITYHRNMNMYKLAIAHHTQIKRSAYASSHSCSQKTSLISLKKLARASTDKQARNTFRTFIYIFTFRLSLKAGSYYKHAGWCVCPHVSQYESTRMMKIGTRACIILKHNSVSDHTEEPYYIYVLALARPYGCNTSHMLHTCPGH